MYCRAQKMEDDCWSGKKNIIVIVWVSDTEKAAGCVIKGKGNSTRSKLPGDD